MQTRRVCLNVLQRTAALSLALAGFVAPAPSALADPFSSEDHWLRRVRGTGGENVLVVDPSAADTPGTLFLWSEDGEEAGPDLEEPIVTDRPDFTEASSTVGVGVFQIESGYTFTSDTEGGVTTRSHSYPEVLMRYGVVANWLELRLAWNYGNELTESVANSSNGFEDLYLGAKIGLTPQDGWRPEMAIVPQMTVPTGADEFSADEVLPGVNWLYGWDVNEFISTAGSTQVNRAVDGDDEYIEWAQSWTVGYSLADNVGAYTEWFAFFPDDAGAAETEHYFDGGFTFYLTNDLMWDVRGGVGLNDAADDYFVGTGVSIRFR
jgi:hypothetical protein